MKSISESSHYKNLANLDKLKDLVTQFGSTYNPTNPQLNLTGLASLKAQCLTDYTNWQAKYVVYKADTNTREIAFKAIDKLCTAIVDNLKTLNIPQQTIDDAFAISKKVHGSSKHIKISETDKIIDPITGTVPLPDPNAPVTISTSQQSFDSITANFEKLVMQAQSISSYAPNETNIKITTLKTLVANLKTVNLNAITATNAVNLSRNQRNFSFYADNTGLYDITKKVKLYTRQIYGTQSSQYHQATAIKFIKIVRKKKAKKTN